VLRRIPTPPRFLSIEGRQAVQTIRAVEQLKAAVNALRGAGKTIAFVPTMGALHAGHLSLVEQGRRLADAVIASIFVNPKQFGEGEDFGRYPRQEQADAATLANAGCDLLWLPAVEDIYPPGFATTVRVAGVSERWEGVARPGHFDGVATVVARLLLAVGPDVAIFGEKDFQQLAVIKRMAADLGLGVGIVGAPIIRDADGLALSSRNAYLSPGDRARATALAEALETTRDAILAGTDVAAAVAGGEALLEAAGFRTDYLALVDAETLEPLGSPEGGMRLIAAATIGSTRLIDNLAI
jgi:pantoate--beta-alanine ligase